MVDNKWTWRTMDLMKKLLIYFVVIGSFTWLIGFILLRFQADAFRTMEAENFNLYVASVVINIIGLWIIIASVQIFLFKYSRVKIKEWTIRMVGIGILVVIISILYFAISIGLPYQDPTPEMKVWQGYNDFSSTIMGGLGVCLAGLGSVAFIVKVLNSFKRRGKEV